MLYDFSGVSTFRGIVVVKAVGSFRFWYCGGFPDSVMFLESKWARKTLIVGSLPVRVGEEIALLSQPGRDLLGILCSQHYFQLSIPSLSQLKYTRPGLPTFSQDVLCKWKTEIKMYRRVHCPNQVTFNRYWSLRGDRFQVCMSQQLPTTLKLQLVSLWETNPAPSQYGCLV